MPCSIIQQIFTKCCCVPGAMFGVLVLFFVFLKKKSIRRSGTSLASAACLVCTLHMESSKCIIGKFITQGAEDLGVRSTSGSGCVNLCQVPNVSET